MRAIEPVDSGRLFLHGFEISYEVFGSEDAPAILLLPAWQNVLPAARPWLDDSCRPQIAGLLRSGERVAVMGLMAQSGREA